MKNENAFRELAVKYFEGRATGDEEKELFDHAGQDAPHLEMFRKWERDWAAAGAEDPATRREWLRLQSRIRIREELQSRLTPRRSLFRRAASVAAITVFGLCGAFGLWKTVESFMPGEYFMVEVPLGEKSKIHLSDGTLVWLNAGSTLRYPDRFGTFNRRVELTGEGYFEVNGKTGSAFIVKTHAYDVRVTGTRFDVSAYPEDAFLTTTLAEGGVELLHGKQRIAMAPGEAILFDTATGKFIRNYVDPSLAYSWTENRIEFDNITLRELVAKLSRQYDVSIHLESESVKEKRFHVSLRNDETIREVLDALKDIIPIRVERKGDDIYFIKSN